MGCVCCHREIEPAPEEKEKDEADKPKRPFDIVRKDGTYGHKPLPPERLKPG